MAYRGSLGETSMKTIVASTSLNAEILGLQDRIGSVTVSKLADLIAVSGNPLTDISVLQNVHFVMKGGTVYKNDAPGSKPTTR
jgi:imidazolonepropionase-like amidohydrolase